MYRIIKGLGLAAGAGLVIVGGFTGAFFSDTETSTGNVFTAGAIDLLVDNESYYNRNVCANIGTEEAPNWVWQGSSLYPVPGTPCTTSFLPSNLDGLLFFDFRDLKPDDEGEDTISIHVQNDAWICMDLTLTSNDDNSSTEPELGDGDAENTDDANDGELAQNIEMFWWADDGDNVYENGEPQITNGVVSLANLDNMFPIALADSENNVWNGLDDSPARAGTSYIAKAWCLGDLSLSAEAQDGLGPESPRTPQTNTGVICNGTALDNKTQTDSAELNIIFSAVQSRNNPDFLCEPREPELATLTVNKALLVSTIGIEVADFTLHIVGPGVDQDVSDEIPVMNLPSGNYVVTETITGDVAGKTFTTTFSGACDAGGNVTLNPGDNLVCNILNNEQGDGIGD